MNPYKHEQLLNSWDVRLVDCFVEQNQTNEWLSAAEVASWVFMVNQPSAYQVAYVEDKITAILGMMWTSEEDKSFLEKAPLCRDRRRRVRLKNLSWIKPISPAKRSVKYQVEKAFAGNDVDALANR